MYYRFPLSVYTAYSFSSIDRLPNSIKISPSKTQLTLHLYAYWPYEQTFGAIVYRK